jgi:short-subunit dehydrogenase
VAQFRRDCFLSQRSARWSGDCYHYITGSTKAAFSAYLSGLRNRLFESKVQVLTVKPGFVATKMTAGLDLPAKLTAQPENVALDIFNAQQKGKDVLYTKAIWRLVMLIIKHIPEFIFKKMSI